ncbi:MAG: GNAT family N-acetyltransferase [Ruminococcaceae bacterium]|nr:GNAT family N-acetyltransferase [Oscillospiraceae bacterium]
MINLRQYKKEDANLVVGWIKNEMALKLWCADRFDVYPLTADKFNEMYEKNGNDDFFGMIAEDEGQTVGHLFFQILNPQKIKFGLIVVDDTKRGMGYGKKMLEAAIVYAKTKFDAKTLTLSVFDSNVSAYRCYLSLGFKETGNKTVYDFFGKKHTYIELEYII